MKHNFSGNSIIDEEEIDLLELVSADDNATNQYLVFYGSNDELYAINISKIRELLVFNDLKRIKKNNTNSFIRSIADVRGTMTPIISFDEWYENDVLKDEEYELIILAGFGGHDFGIMVKKVEYIININPSNMQDNSSNNNKTNFIAYIKLSGKERLCTVFDGDKMLLDVFDDANKNAQIDNVISDKKIISNKYILFADDSKFIRKMVESVILKLELKVKVFENGALLLNALNNMEVNDVGLIITDLEMPVMNGNKLIKNIRLNKLYSKIKILVHTNMSNDIMSESLIKLGAQSIIEKIDTYKLSEAIKEHYSND